MKNVVKRLILFSVALPLLGVMMIFVPHFQYVWIMLVLTFIGFKCGHELRAMLRQIDQHIPGCCIIFPAIAPLLAWLNSREILAAEISVLALILAIIWVFAEAGFTSESNISGGFQRIGARLIMVLYPGFFLWWIQSAASLPNVRLSPLIFTLAVYLNDSAAWCVGMLFGKHRGLVPVSPNKSLEGFIAGIVSTIIVLLAASRLLPGSLAFPTWQLVLFGIVLGAAAILGDLAESALKRAAGVKDSGQFILGRGGMLDSIDSMFFAAPIYVLFISSGEWFGA